MKIIFYSLLITLFACSSQVQEFAVSNDNEVDDITGDVEQGDTQQDTDQTYPTPSKSDNKRGSGCRSVFYIYGKKVVVPCAPSLPHGPIYESGNLKTDYVEK